MLHHNLKKEFQVERIAFFSDAVFAIAITLLIIEVKVPEIHGHTDAASFAHALSELTTKFIGFVSFFVIGNYWVNHHQLFKFVSHYNQRLIWANMFLLFSVVIMPFSSAFYSDYTVTFNMIPLGVYVFNIMLTGLMNTRLWFIVSNPKYKLSEGLENPNLGNYFKTRALVPPFVFLFTFFVGFINIFIAYWCPALIWPGMALVKKYFLKHHPEIFMKHQ